MKEFIKIERSLIASFLMNVDKCINYTYPENKLSIVESLRQMEEIKKIIQEQDGDKVSNNKFKQIALL